MRTGVLPAASRKASWVPEGQLGPYVPQYEGLKADKNHIVRAPHFYEQDYFTPGDDGFVVVPDGSVAALAGKGEELLLADMDYKKSSDLRKAKQYLSLRRPEVFELT